MMKPARRRALCRLCRRGASEYLRARAAAARRAIGAALLVTSTARCLRPCLLLACRFGFPLFDWRLQALLICLLALEQKPPGQAAQVPPGAEGIDVFFCR